MIKLIPWENISDGHNNVIFEKSWPDGYEKVSVCGKMRPKHLAPLSDGVTLKVKYQNQYHKQEESNVQVLHHKILN